MRTYAEKRWVEKRAAPDADTDKPNLLTSKTAAVKGMPEKGVYSRGLMLKVLGVQTEAPHHAPTDSTATESGRSSPEVQDEEEGDDGAKQAKEKVKTRAVSMDATTEKSDVGLQLRPRAMSDGTAEAASAETGASMATPTTVMLRNIPNQYSREKLCKRLDSQGFEGLYDFLYLPIDRNSERNMGYAFINFRTQNACADFARCFSGKMASDCLPGYKSNKVCEVRVAEVQGQQANLEKMTSPNFFQHLAEHEEWQPIFFDEKGERMPLAARETPDGHGKRSRQGSRSTPSPKLLPFMPPMVPYAFPGLPMAAMSSKKGKRSGPGDIKHGAKVGLPFGPEVAAETANAMVAKHLEAEAAARAAAAAQARLFAGRPKDVKKQIEYYFSVQNISHDLYLRKLMDESGWVNLKDIVKFPKLRALFADVATCAAALAGSETVELSEDGLRVRISNADLRNAYPQVVEAKEKDAEPAATSAKDMATAVGGA